MWQLHKINLFLKMIENQAKAIMKQQHIGLGRYFSDT